MGRSSAWFALSSPFFMIVQNFKIIFGKKLQFFKVGFCFSDHERYI